jgi:hypothetical protein
MLQTMYDDIVVWEGLGGANFVTDCVLSKFMHAPTVPYQLASTPVRGAANRENV